MTDTALYRELSTLLTASGGSELLHRMTSHYLSWDEFMAMRLPSEMSPEATWRILKLMGRSMGIDVPIPDIEGNEYWYMRTHEIADGVARITCMCRADSDLYRSLTNTHNRRVLVQSRIDETVAAAQLDGLILAPDDAQALLQLDRTPKNDVERLVRNALSVLDDLGTLVNVPFSKELFWHLRYLLLEGVDVRNIESAERRMGIMQQDYAEEQVRIAADRQLELICAYLNHTSGEVHDHAVMRALLLPDVMRFYRPLPDLNSEVGRLAFRLYAMKVGLPVLGMLPLSHIKLQWEEQRLESQLVTITPEAYARSRELDGGEMTGYSTLAVQFALAALEELSYNLSRIAKRDEELRAILQLDPTINHRQRSILGRAMRNPSAEFRIAYHKNVHNVVYATARADLLELVEKGFLEIGKQGRAMVFTPRPGLREYIEQLYAQKSG